VSTGVEDTHSNPTPSHDKNGLSRKHPAFCNRLPGWLVCATVLLLLPAVASAVIITKANNTVNLNLTNRDVAVWDRTVTGAKVVDLGADQSWPGLAITNPAGAVTSTSAVPATLTLGAGGLHLAGATTYLAAYCGLILGDSQTWSVAGCDRLAV
jgi:hypothetical protein